MSSQILSLLKKHITNNFILEERVIATDELWIKYNVLGVKYIFKIRKQIKYIITSAKIVCLNVYFYLNYCIILQQKKYVFF